MDRTDARKLSIAALNERRRRAVQLRLSGMKLNEVAALAELARGTVIAAVKAYRQGGWDAVASGRRGVKPGQGCTLHPIQQQTIRTLIHDMTPDRLGLPFALWSRTAVLALIAQQFDIAMPVRTVGHYLKRWGFTPQKPINRAYEQNRAAVHAWLQHDYPAIEARAKQEGGEIHWSDETGLRSDDVRGRSYAPKGSTPVVQTAHRRENVGLISAVTHRGKARWMILPRAINAALLIDFLQRLAQDAPRKVFLIVDNLKVHHAPAVKAWLDAHRDRLEMFFLPSYSPELNPDELLNADLKAAITKQAPKRAKGELKRAVIRHLRKIAKSPQRVRQYFQHEPVRYAA